MQMQKRGQVTLFIILGVVIVILAALYFFVAKPYVLPVSQEDLNKEMRNVEEDVLNCLFEVSEEPFNRIGLQGGYLATPTGSYRLYNDSRISYLCYDIPGEATCYNRMLLIQSMEKELEEAIKDTLPTCLNVHKFSQLKPYTVSTPKQPNIDVSIRRFDSLVTLDYPIRLTSKKSATSVEKSEFEAVLTIPLGRLYEVSQEIVNQEAQYGTFETLYYMLSKKGEIKIYLKKPYPDKIYQLKHQNSEYVFQFAIEDEPS